MLKARPELATGAKKSPVDIVILLGVAINAAIIGAIVLLWALSKP